MSDTPPTPPDQSKAEHIIAYRIATWSERSENPDTLPGMTEAEIKAYYLGRLQEAQAMIDLLNDINRGQDATWAMPTSSNAVKALETAFHGTLEAPQSIPWADHEASTKAITRRFRGHVDKERHKRQTAEKALETAQNQITTLRAELDELKETHLRMCATLRECVQKHNLGLGGEHLDTLVAQRIEAQTAAIESAAACLGHLKQRDWFNDTVTGDVVCTLNANLVRTTIAKLQALRPPTPLP